MPSLIKVYQNLISSKSIIDDPIQRGLIKELEIVSSALTQRKSWLHKLRLKKQHVNGLYMWGGVGIGKTFLMDLFFDALPIKKKLRLHFHQFMQEIQIALRAHQGEANPLQVVALEIAQKAEVLCFDEFFVSDIADAMILERLFNQLFAYNVVLIATSNIPPDKLYLKGLHRKRFLPAIELIKEHCKIINIASQADYRYRALTEANVFFTPITPSTQTQLEQLFELYSANDWQDNAFLHIEKRQIQARRAAEKVVWFEFDVICHTPRSQVDYLRIAEQYDIVIVSNVPVMSAQDKAAITYFIHLVDVFYDKHIKLILSADATIEALYTEGDKVFEYQRTISRLHEMRTKEYLL